MTDTHKKNTSPWLNDKAYNVLKFIAQIGLPALGTFYAALAGLWDFPAVMQVVGTIVALDTFLGVLLGISSAQYAAVGGGYDGVMEVHPTNENGAPVYQLAFDHYPEHLATKKSLSLKVEHVAPVEEVIPGTLPPV